MDSIRPCAGAEEQAEQLRVDRVLNGRTVLRHHRGLEAPMITITRAPPRPEGTAQPVSRSRRAGTPAAGLPPGDIGRFRRSAAAAGTAPHNWPSFPGPAMTDPDAHAPLPADLLACHECDLLQTTPVLRPAETARCVLPCAPWPATRPTAWIAAWRQASRQRCCAIANLHPLVDALEMQGRRVEISLLRAVGILWRDGVEPVAALVFVTAQLFRWNWAVILVVLPLRLGRCRPGSPPLPSGRSVQPWGMVEVSLLGMLVSLVKLSTGHRHPGHRLLGHRRRIVILTWPPAPSIRACCGELHR